MGQVQIVGQSGISHAKLVTQSINNCSTHGVTQFVWLLTWKLWVSEKVCYISGVVHGFLLYLCTCSLSLSLPERACAHAITLLDVVLTKFMTDVLSMFYLIPLISCAVCYFFFPYFLFFNLTGWSSSVGY